MRGKFRNTGSNRRDHRARRQERSGNYKFVRRGENNFGRDRRRNFDNRRNNFSRSFKRRGKLSREKLNEELDNYFERKGGESLKDHLDNELEVYKNNAKINENTTKENISLPVQPPQPKEEEKKVEEKNVEMKVETQEAPKEAEVKEVVEEKKDDKKKKKRGKK